MFSYQLVGGHVAVVVVLNIMSEDSPNLPPLIAAGVSGFCSSLELCCEHEGRFT